MQIIKHGKYYYNWMFKCESCGCQFYEEGSKCHKIQMTVMRNQFDGPETVDGFAMECPECGRKCESSTKYSHTKADTAIHEQGGIGTDL